MILARVTGTVVSSHKDPGADDMKLLLVERLQPEPTGELAAKNEYLVAMDSVGAGTGEVVLIVAGSSARMTQATTGRPCDCAIMGVIDLVTLEGELVYQKSEDNRG